jgi:hypothetical protein
VFDAVIVPYESCSALPARAQSMRSLEVAVMIFEIKGAEVAAAFERTPGALTMSVKMRQCHTIAQTG